jgi:hypothetical protein
MTVQAQQILKSFDLLPDGDKREVVAEILRRSLATDVPPLADDELVDAADRIFLGLDAREESDASIEPLVART